MNQVLYPQERRESSRHHATFRAWVEDAHHQRLECEVMDMSSTGARLHVPDAALPDEFMLILDAESSHKRHCKIVWRTGFTVGLQFV